MDAFINPLTQDYVINSGAAVRDVGGGLGNAVYLRIMTPLGSYWADKTLGSRLHELQREKDVARVEVLAKQYAQQALQPLLDDGRAKSIAVAVQRPGNGRMHLLVEVIAASGEVLTFNHPVKVM